jgi:chaperonin cofactor prefoldin
MENQPRLEVLEGRVEELSRHWHDLFVELGRVDQNIDALGVALSGRIDALAEKFDRRFEAIDRRFEAIDRRFEAIDRRFETIDRKFDDLRAELSKQFRWTFSTMLALLGMMLTVGAGVATALLRN